MSVGESTYYNYPDATLGETLVRDTVDNIIPELAKNKQSVDAVFSGGRRVRCTVLDGVIDVSDLRVLADETSVAFPDGQVMSIHQFPDHLSPDDPLYYRLRIRDLEIDTMEIARYINERIKSSEVVEKSSVEACQVKISDLKNRVMLLSTEVEKYYSAAADDISEVIDKRTLEERINKMLSVSDAPNALTVDGRRSVYTMMAQLRALSVAEIHFSTKVSSTPEKDSLSAIDAILELTIQGLQVMRIGGRLSQEIGNAIALLAVYYKLICVFFRERLFGASWLWRIQALDSKKEKPRDGSCIGSSGCLL